LQRLQYPNFNLYRILLTLLKTKYAITFPIVFVITNTNSMTFVLMFACHVIEVCQSPEIIG